MQNLDYKSGSHPFPHQPIFIHSVFLLIVSSFTFTIRAQTTAVPVTDFLNSIGVCTHIGQGVDNAAQSATAMTYAGIRNLRDDGRSSHIQDWITVYDQSGVRTCLLTDQNITSTVTMAKQLRAAGALLAVEGPNEPNNWPVTYQGQTSSDTTSLPIAKFQRDLYAAVKAEPALSGIPVFHSSEAGGSEPDNCGLQFLTIPAGAGTLMPDGTVFADFANTHNYVCGTQNADLGDNQAWNAADPTLNGPWDGLYVEYGHTWWGAGFNGYTNQQLLTLPRVTTETGWTTGGTGKNITEDQQGRLFLNLYLSQFKRNWKYTFIYMLRDDPNQGYWGLFHTDYTPKPSGTYLHNFTAILADTGTIATPGRLDYSIPSQPATVHDLLMQKHDGTLELAVWSEKASGTEAVTVNLNAVFATVKVYDPVAGAAPAQNLSNANSVQLSLSDHPVIIEIPNQAAAAPLTRGEKHVDNADFTVDASATNAVIRYYTGSSQGVTFFLYDMRGRLVKTLADGNQDAGYHAVFLSEHGKNGVYFCRMETEGISAARKIQIVR
ncbi:MAG TPA: T9SS type A sorting domain-containing protein [Chitinivibrionales bacterium]|nr:T9SS type A sorting domain-containing protein [Chitinivibrionales bacterium]